MCCNNEDDPKVDPWLYDFWLRKWERKLSEFPFYESSAK